jgi:hypothetical protein
LGNSPGAVIDSSDHSSMRLFSIGVPVIATLKGAVTFRAHWYALDRWFLTYCASSSTSPDQGSDPYDSKSSRSSVYEVTTASAPAITDSSGTPRRASVSPIVTTFRSGVNRCASAAQFASTLVGATMRNGTSRTGAADSAALMALA